MNYKKGGGNHLQPYDEKTGQYDDETKAKINEEEKKSLILFHYFGLPYNDLDFRFPVFNLHDDEYCDIFVKYSRKVIKYFDIDDRKGVHFLQYKIKDDKSLFLKKLGYSLENYHELISDIYCNTNVNSLTFSKFDKQCLKCIAKTILRGKIVTSVWELKSNFHIRLITIIPGGDKRWK